MNKDRQKIPVLEQDGIYRVAAELKEGFHLIPSPAGTITLAFWERERLDAFLEDFGFYPEIIGHN